MNKFLVSLCTVAYNEENCVGNLLADFQSQTYPKKLTQIVLVDSASTDKTKEIFLKFKNDHENEYHSIIVEDNIKRKQSSGWNVAISKSLGDIIIRVDAHAHIPGDFTENNVFYHENGEMVTGGVRPNIIDDETPYKRLLLMAESSLFGSSVADFRHQTEKKSVNSLFHGAYRREVFENAGLFNETLGRTEDNEMHYRIRKAGYTISLCPNIISYQQTRNTLPKMLKQKWGNGYWIGRTAFICPKCLSVYHFIPFVFICGILGALLFSFLFSPIFAALYFGLYFTAAIAMSVPAIIGEKQKYPIFVILPLLFFLLHFSYGFGTLVGFFSLLYKKQ